MGKMKDLAIDQANAVKELQKHIDTVSGLTEVFDDYNKYNSTGGYMEWSSAVRAFRMAFLDVFDIAAIFPWFKEFDKEDFIECGEIYTNIKGPEGVLVFSVTLYVGADQVQICTGDYITEVFCCPLKDFPSHYNDFILSSKKVREYADNAINTLNSNINEIKTLVQ